jgi:hypothetical protein
MTTNERAIANINALDKTQENLMWRSHLHAIRRECT